MSWNRCVMICSEGSYTLTVDLMLDNEDVVGPTLRYFGEIRSMLNHVTPVVILPESGIVDFGSHMEEEIRYGNMYLHDQQVAIGERFAFMWNDGGGDLELVVDSIVPHLGSGAPTKGGRPRKDAAWTAFWLAITEIAQDRRLNLLQYASQEALAKDLLENYEIDLSYDSIKPRISQLWHKLQIDQQ